MPYTFEMSQANTFTATVARSTASARRCLMLLNASPRLPFTRTVVDEFAGQCAIRSLLDG